MYPAMSVNTVLRARQSARFAGAAFERVDLGDFDEPIGIGKRQRTQQHGVDDGKHRGCGADAYGERRNRHGRKRRLFPQRSECISKILQRRLDDRERLRLAVLFADLHRSSKSDERRPARFVRRHAVADMFLGQQLQVDRYLFVEVRIAAVVPAKQAGDARDGGPHPDQHGCQRSDSRSSRPMTAAIRCQLSASDASCFRPVLVIA